MQVHPPAQRSPVSCLPARRCHLLLRHHIPFRASKERGKFFLFWVLRAAGCGWKGVAATWRSPNGDRLPPPPDFLPWFWQKAGDHQKKRAGNVQIAQSVAQPQQLSAVFTSRHPPCLSFPTLSRRISFSVGWGFTAVLQSAF